MICNVNQVHTGISVTNQCSVDKATMVNIKATNVVTKADRARTTFSLAISALCSRRLLHSRGILEGNNVDTQKMSQNETNYCLFTFG